MPPCSTPLKIGVLLRVVLSLRKMDQSIRSGNEDAAILPVGPSGTEAQPIEVQ